MCVVIPDAMEKRTLQPRLIWKFGDANWQAIEDRLANIDWNCLSTGSVDDALDFLNNILERLMEAHVPHFMKTESRSNLPWVNNECRLAISAKHAAQDTDSYAEASACCTAVLRRVRAPPIFIN